MNATTATHVAAEVRRKSLGAPALVTLYASLITLPHAIAEIPIRFFVQPQRKGSFGQNRGAFA
jgi:hypothetical protein